MAEQVSELKILTGVRSLIETPEKWCQGDYAMNAVGEVVNVRDQSAVRFCLIGALIKVGGWNRSLPNLKKHTGGSGWLTEFNDIHTHAQVIAAIDKAIAACKRKPANA